MQSKKVAGTKLANLKKKTHIGIGLRPETLKQIDELVKLHSIPRQRIIEYLIRKALENGLDKGLSGVEPWKL